MPGHRVAEAAWSVGAHSVLPLRLVESRSNACCRFPFSLTEQGMEHPDKVRGIWRSHGDSNPGFRRERATS